MSTDTDTEIIEQTPDVDPYDAAFAEMDAAEAAAAQPRDESGRFASPTQEQPETPVETPEAVVETAVETPPQPERRVFRVKVDKEEREVDIDAEWADETRRAQFQAIYEKGSGFDRVVERTKQEAQREGQARTIAWMESQGYKVAQNPMTGQWEVRAPQAATPAAAPTPAPVAMPEQRVDRERLAHVAKYGDGSEDPAAAQIAAVIELSRLNAEEAASAKFKAFEDWRGQMTRQAQEAQAAQMRARTENAVMERIKATIDARAKSFEGPDRDRQIARVESLAMAKARSDARTIEDVLQIVTEAANDLDLRREFWLRSAAPQAAIPAATPSKPATPKPTPSLDGVPAGSANGKARARVAAGDPDPFEDPSLYEGL